MKFLEQLAQIFGVTKPSKRLSSKEKAKRKKKRKMAAKSRKINRQKKK